MADQKHITNDVELFEKFDSYCANLTHYNKLEGEQLDDDDHPYRIAWNQAHDAMDTCAPPTTLQGAALLLRFGLASNGTSPAEETLLLYGSPADRTAYIQTNWGKFNTELRHVWGALAAIETALAPASSAEFDAALAEYRAKRAASDALPLGTAGEDEAVDAYCVAMDHLIEQVPSPNLAAIVTKLELARERGESYNDGILPDHRDALLADLQRLATAEQSNALRPVAEAWVDRWTALGGSFGRIYDTEGKCKGLTRGIPMSYIWQPPSYEEAQARSPQLQPHEMILQREQFDGAHKMLESLLTLIPGLNDAVREVASDLLDQGKGHADPDTIRRFLERRGFYGTAQQQEAK